MNKKVLLIADDDEINRRIIRRFLKDTFDVMEAENGRQTMEIQSILSVLGIALCGICNKNTVVSPIHFVECISIEFITEKECSFKKYSLLFIVIFMLPFNIYIISIP